MDKSSVWRREERVVVMDKSSILAPRGARSHYGQEVGFGAERSA